MADEESSSQEPANVVLGTTPSEPAAPNHVVTPTNGYITLLTSDAFAKIVSLPITILLSVVLLLLLEGWWLKDGTVKDIHDKLLSIEKVGSVEFSKLKNEEQAVVGAKYEEAIRENAELKSRLAATNILVTTVTDAATQSLSPEFTGFSRSGGSVNGPPTLAGSEGYIWIGNASDDGNWKAQKISLPDGGSITTPPGKLENGRYKLLGNMVLRKLKPDQGPIYFRNSDPLGVVPQGVTVEVIDTPVQYKRPVVGIQYWANVRIPQ